MDTGFTILHIAITTLKGKKDPWNKASLQKSIHNGKNKIFSYSCVTPVNYVKCLSKKVRTGSENRISENLKNLCYWNLQICSAIHVRRARNIPESTKDIISV